MTVSSDPNGLSSTDSNRDIARLLSRIADSLDQLVTDSNDRHQHMMEYVDKTLHIASVHYDLFAQRSGRPYYPLDDKWGLTKLDTGENFFINTNDRNVTPWIIMGGHWEKNVERVLVGFVRPGMAVCDIGAHFGYYTVKLGSRIGRSGRLFAFEPNPEVNAVCMENIKINGLSDIARLHKYALGDVETTATLTRSASNMASANLLGEQEADYSVSVDVKRLDDVMPNNLSIDLIKLDAEGYEKRILDGAIGLLARSPRAAIMIELGLERWEMSAPLSGLVQACGGNKQVFAVHDDGTLEQFAEDRIRDFLLTCGFHENYFFVASENVVREHVGHLLRNA